MPERIRILHLSDLHERAPFPGMPSNREPALRLDAAERGLVLGETFVNTIAQLGIEGIDLVFMTGDVADWGRAEEYIVAEERLDKILAAAQVDRSRFFAVPGNHDVQRQLSKDAWAGIRAWLDATSDVRSLGRWLFRVTETLPGLQDRWRDEILHRTSGFWSWFSRYNETVLCPPSNTVLGYRKTFGRHQLASIPVNIIGLDSAWLCGEDKERGRVPITAEQLLSHTRNGEHRLEGLSIGLVHHPLTQMLDQESAWGLLANAGVALLLHGHQHNPTATQTSIPGASLKVLAAGCLMEGDFGADYPNEFHLVEIEIPGSKITVHFKKWASNATVKFWTPGTDLYPNATSGTLRWDWHMSEQGGSQSEATEICPTILTPSNKRLLATPKTERRAMSTLGLGIGWLAATALFPDHPEVQLSAAVIGHHAGRLITNRLLSSMSWRFTVAKISRDITRSCLNSKTEIQAASKYTDDLFRSGGIVKSTTPRFLLTDLAWNQDTAPAHAKEVRRSIRELQISCPLLFPATLAALKILQRYLIHYDVNLVVHAEHVTSKKQVVSLANCRAIDFAIIADAPYAMRTNSCARGNIYDLRFPIFSQEDCLLSVDESGTRRNQIVYFHEGSTAEILARVGPIQGGYTKRMPLDGPSDIAPIFDDLGIGEYVCTWEPITSAILSRHSNVVVVPGSRLTSYVSFYTSSKWRSQNLKSALHAFSSLFSLTWRSLKINRALIEVLKSSTITNRLSQLAVM